MAITLVLGMLQPGYLQLLMLDPARILGRGGAKFPEVWRLVTYRRDYPHRRKFVYRDDVM